MRRAAPRHHLMATAALVLAVAGCPTPEDDGPASGRGGVSGGAGPGSEGRGGSGAPGSSQGGAPGSSQGGSPAAAGGTAGTAGAPAAGGATGAGGTTSGSGGASGRGGSSNSDAGAAPADGSPAPAPAGAVVWNIDNLTSIAGHATSRSGAPTVIEVAGAGKALQFDGQDDALFVDAHPARGLSQFTIEVIFRPDAGGAPAQRFFHLEENAGGRLLWETRLPGGGGFVADIFVQSRAGNVALYAPSKVHPLGQWYNLALVVDGKQVRSYVNGVEESTSNMGFTPHGAGRTSIGVRINRLYHFKGAIRLARFTPRVLTPAELLPAP